MYADTFGRLQLSHSCIWQRSAQQHLVCPANFQQECLRAIPASTHWNNTCSRITLHRQTVTAHYCNYCNTILRQNTATTHCNNTTLQQQSATHHASTTHCISALQQNLPATTHCNNTHGTTETYVWKGMRYATYLNQPHTMYVIHCRGGRQVSQLTPNTHTTQSPLSLSLSLSLSFSLSLSLSRSHTHPHAHIHIHAHTHASIIPLGFIGTWWKIYMNK